MARFGPDEGEDVVLRCLSAEAVEVHCHGGRRRWRRSERALVAGGCRLLAWDDGLAARKTTPIARAARLALAEARTQRTAAILLDQYGGALRRAFAEIDAAVAQKAAERAAEMVERLLARAPLGRHLTTPWQVVLAGRPNVGKSSLINALLGYTRAIVHHSPGTTRDVVTAVTAIDGWPVELSDTAGLREPATPLNRRGWPWPKRNSRRPTW